MISLSTVNLISESVNTPGLRTSTYSISNSVHSSMKQKIARKSYK